MQGLANIIVKKAKTRKLTMLVCVLCGAAIFFDGAPALTCNVLALTSYLHPSQAGGMACTGAACCCHHRTAMACNHGNCSPCTRRARLADDDCRPGRRTICNLCADYASSLIVGNTFRPIMDMMMISREKLAYIVDSTSAPVASVSPISSWVGAHFNSVSCCQFAAT